MGTDAKSGREKYRKPQGLREFMRHTSLQVTLDYYVGQRSMETASAMWAAHERYLSGRRDNG